MKFAWLDTVGKDIIAAIKAKTDNLPATPSDEVTAQAAVVQAQVAAAKVDLFNSSEMFIFPQDTSRTCIFIAGGVANTWSAWTEIADNIPTTLSSYFAAQSGYLADIIAFEFSIANKSYMLEISFGPTNIIIGRLALYSRAGAVNNMLIKSRQIPANQTIYYRMMCENGGANCRMQFRYFYG